MPTSTEIELAKALGWKTINGRWWKDSFGPLQNTWTWDRVHGEVFGKYP